MPSPGDAQRAGHSRGSEEHERLARGPRVPVHLVLAIAAESEQRQHQGAEGHRDECRRYHQLRDTAAAKHGQGAVGTMQQTGTQALKHPRANCPRGNP